MPRAVVVTRLDHPRADFDELERTTELPTEHIEAVLKALEVLTSEDT